MNAQIQAQLDRVEAALTTLIDSITTYNPSPAAAIALSTADDDLVEGLEQLTIHQRNHALILSLRAQSTALDERIKSTLTQLAATRVELLSSVPAAIASFPLISSTSSSSSSTFHASTSTSAPKQVDYATLLSYAARIAKFTVPPTSRRGILPPISPEEEVDNSNNNNRTVVLPVDPTAVVVAAAAATTTTANGTTPPVPDAAAIVDAALAAAAAETAAVAEAQQQQQQSPITTSSSFIPWPRDEYIRLGALARIQAARDRGMSSAELESADLMAVEGEVVADAGQANVEGQDAAQGSSEREAVSVGERQRGKEEVEEEGGEAQGKKKIDAGVVQQQQQQRPQASVNNRKPEPAREEVFEGFELYNPDEM